MKIQNLMETSLPEMYTQKLFNEKNKDLAAEHTDKISYVLFGAVSEILKSIQSKEHPVVYLFERLDGSIISAAILRYFKNENAEAPGNWSFVWTFEPNDIPDNAVKISIKDEKQSHSYFRAIAGDKWGMKFKSAENLIVLMNTFLEVLYAWLDENAKEDEEVVIKQDTVFKARVGIENGVKVMSIEPMGEVKKDIKNDVMLEQQ